MRHPLRLAALCLAAGLTACASGPPARIAPMPSAGAPGFDAARLARIDGVVEAAIARRELPGAVVVVGRGDAIVWQKAYGHRALVPAPEPMTLDTVFDLASLTKVVATTTAVMMLVEEGQIRLSDRVATFIPGFERYGKDRITVRDLLVHMSGLRPDVDLVDDWVGYDEAIRLATEELPTDPPGRRFVYSDINFFVLAEIVARVSGRPFDEFVRARIFEPLQMRDTMFRPPDSLAARIAPTEACTAYGWPCQGPDMRMLRGVVHDPTARRMQGVAGHAGLFSTASDLVNFVRMLLGGGEFGGTRLLSPLTVARMTSPATPAGEPAVRGLGWDIDTTYSANRGELLPLGSFGHTGFTGTSLWIDPASGLYVVFLSSRLHPDGKGDVTPLRARVATLAAAALTAPVPAAAAEAGWSRPAAVQAPAPTPVTSPVRTGVDVLRAEGFAAHRGLRVSLLTNHTGVARDGTPTIDVLARAPDVRLVSLMSPEHGIRGVLDEAVSSTTDPATGLTIHSLYGATRRPTEEMLAGLDAIVIDLQDIGTRFYTYMTTMAYVMEAAAARRIKVFVLDRPNPIGGAVEGPPLDENAVGFTGYLPAMPIRHGLTLGELARLFNGEKGIGADLTVVAMTGWRRDLWFDQTTLAWINPSPNMRTLYGALLYPGLGAFEQTNLSVGRGTDKPFEQIGAPWLDGVALAEALNRRDIPGVRFYPVRFTPSASKFAGQECGGVFVVVTDRDRVRSVRMGVEIASALTRLFPSDFDPGVAARLYGSAAGLARIKAGDDPAAIAASWAPAERNWRRIGDKYRLY